MILPSQLSSLYQHMETISPKELGIRKKLNIFIANDSKNQKYLIFHINQKSRFLQKDVDKIEEINNIVKNSITHLVISKVIFIESPLCSKAKAKLEQSNWTVLV